MRRPVEFAWAAGMPFGGRHAAHDERADDRGCQARHRAEPEAVTGAEAVGHHPDERAADRRASGFQQPQGRDFCVPPRDQRPCSARFGLGSMGFMRELLESPSAAMAAVERRMRLLETRVEAIAEAVEVLARGLEGSPTAEPVSHPASEAGRRAHELLLVAKPDRKDG